MASIHYDPASGTYYIYCVEDDCPGVFLTGYGSAEDASEDAAYHEGNHDEWYEEQAAATGQAYEGY